MSYTFQDAEHEEGLEYLYKEFKQQFEDDFVYEKVFDFYKSNPEISVEPLLNLKEAEKLFEFNHFTASFLHAAISIETGVKIIIFKPILSSLSLDQRATDLLFKDTFRTKSIPQISSFYYQILSDLTKINFKEIKRDRFSKTLWFELQELQKTRNKIIHQGKLVTNEIAEYSISISKFLFEKTIPAILKVYNFKIVDTKIVYK